MFYFPVDDSRLLDDPSCCLWVSPRVNIMLNFHSLQSCYYNSESTGFRVYIPFDMILYVYLYSLYGSEQIYYAWSWPSLSGFTTESWFNLVLFC